MCCCNVKDKEKETSFYTIPGPWYQKQSSSLIRHRGEMAKENAGTEQWTKNYALKNTLCIPHRTQFWLQFISGALLKLNPSLPYYISLFCLWSRIIIKRNCMNFKIKFIFLFLHLFCSCNTPCNHILCQKNEQIDNFI